MSFDRSRVMLLLASVAFLGVNPSAAWAKGADWKGYEAKPDAWYRSDEGKRIVANVLSRQSPRGGWPKDMDTSIEPLTGDPSKIKGTFDNGATTGEIRFLTRAYRVNGDAASRDAVLKAIDHILEAQYPNGGWPQFFPPGKEYHRHITFNDDSMVKLMDLMREVNSSPRFAFVGEARRASCRKAFDAGIACILKCQVTVNGEKTVWCAQHDEVTLEPRAARKFEPVSLSGGESASLVGLLMSLDNPSPEVKSAIEAAAKWFDTVKIEGIRQTVVDGDKVIVADKSTLPLWARFYEIGTNKPIFSGRDSVVKYNLAEIEPERRNGYAWYGNWGQRVATGYARWRVAHGRATPG